MLFLAVTCCVMNFALPPKTAKDLPLPWAFMSTMPAVSPSAAILNGFLIFLEAAVSLSRSYWQHASSHIQELNCNKYHTGSLCNGLLTGL